MLQIELPGCHGGCDSTACCSRHSLRSHHLLHRRIRTYTYLHVKNKHTVKMCAFKMEMLTIYAAVIAMMIGSIHADVAAAVICAKAVKIDVQMKLCNDQIV